MLSWESVHKICPGWVGVGTPSLRPQPLPYVFIPLSQLTRFHFHFRRGQSANKHIIRDPLSMESLFSKFVLDHEMHK